MALNKITVNIETLGLGRALAGEDHVSGIVFYTDSLPSGFGASDRIKRIKSVQEAEDLGILNDKSDETKATGGQFQITAAGAADDVWTATITPSGGSAITLGAYTEQSGDGVNDIASGLRSAINALTNTHGFVAAGATDLVTLTAPTGYGDSINTSGLSLASSGAGTDTTTQFSGGVDAELDVFHYHISEYFRIQPKGDLYVGIYAATGVDLSKIEDVQNYAQGKIRQIAVFDHNTTFASSQVGTLQTSATNLDAVDRRLNVLYAADFVGLTLSALPNLKALNSKKVSVVIGQDASGTGNTLADDRAYSITCIGAALGAVSLANVSENIGYVEKFNLVTGTEMLEVEFAEKTLFRDTSLTLETQLHDYGYIYAKNHDFAAGTYFNDSTTATAGTSDFSNIEANRQIDKAIREVKTALQPKLLAPLFVDADGKLSQTTIEVFRADAQSAVDAMVINDELSGAAVLIDPDQNVLSTSEIAVTLQIIPVGAARAIVLNVGFVTSLSEQ